MKYKTIATTLLASSLTISLTAVAANESSDTSKTKGAMDKAAPVVVVVPTVFALKPDLADGCWARLYDSENYAGNMLTLTGPVDIPEAGTGIIAGYELGHNFDSVVVGPKATLTVWDNDNYLDKSATFTPGQKVPNLDSKLGYFEGIESFKVAC